MRSLPLGSCPPPLAEEVGHESNGVGTVTLFLYILAASSDPDNIDCMVPYRINDQRIFFGPCKRRLREWLRDKYLHATDDYSLQNHETLSVVGFNASNSQRLRRIVWAGHITRVMTFEVAYETLKGPTFNEMRSLKRSPLHLEPCYDRQHRFEGYRLVSKYHCSKNEWVTDVVRPNALKQRKARHQGNRILLAPGEDRRQVFTRDCCFLCDNIFYAQGGGIPINDAIVGILRRAQPDRRDQVDDYAIFGRRKDSGADGRTGGYLTVSGEDAERMIRLIQHNRPTRIPQAAPPAPRRSPAKDRGC